MQEQQARKTPALGQRTGVRGQRSTQLGVKFFSVIGKEDNLQPVSLVVQEHDCSSESFAIGDWADSFRFYALYSVHVYIHVFLLID